jgi:hypothetical protein
MTQVLTGPGANCVHKGVQVVPVVPSRLPDSSVACTQRPDAACATFLPPNRLLTAPTSMAHNKPRPDHEVNPLPQQRPLFEGVKDHEYHVVGPHSEIRQGGLNGLMHWNNSSQTSTGNMIVQALSLKPTMGASTNYSQTTEQAMGQTTWQYVGHNGLGSAPDYKQQVRTQTIY